MVALYYSRSRRSTSVFTDVRRCGGRLTVAGVGLLRKRRNGSSVQSNDRHVLSLGASPSIGGPSSGAVDAERAAPRLAIYRTRSNISTESSPPSGWARRRRACTGEYATAISPLAMIAASPARSPSAIKRPPTFDHACHPQLRSDGHDLAAERTEQLLGAVECEQHPKTHAEGCIERAGKARQGSFQHTVPPSVLQARRKDRASPQRGRLANNKSDPRTSEARAGEARHHAYLQRRTRRERDVRNATSELSLK